MAEEIIFAALLLIAIFVDPGQAKIRSAAFKITTEYRQQGGVSQSLGGHSREDCSMVCLADMSCVGVNYHQGTGACETYGFSARTGANTAGWVHLVHDRKCYVTHGPYGNLRESTFDDAAVSSSGPITGVTIRGASWIDSIQFKYGGTPGQHAGGDGGSPQTLQFTENEFITKIVITLHYSFVESLTFYTNLATYGPYGVPTTTETVLNFTNERRLSYISGRYGTYLNAIAFHQEADCGQEILS
ncbi:mannose/glucose-specific lectin [Lingula anatina]|uniref:Mannose/glucose-specific lectin n=1 Tax=Lingula anatina TaxID=7574 RepID=A0A1S3J5W9_LINAN|nr:mannose/glucose-specific lectin [Lingula anatina]|eukprot:XP_013405790.1 mannose/glucose-specific lectin [Lingula anatina]